VRVKFCSQVRWAAVCATALLVAPTAAFGQRFYVPPAPSVAPQAAQNALLTFPHNLLGILRYLNRAGYNFNDVLVSQVATGEDITQLVTVNVQSRQNPGVRATPYGLVMYLPAPEVSRIRSLNMGVNISVVDLQQIALGNDITQVAVVNIQQNGAGSGRAVMVPNDAFAKLYAVNRQFQINLSRIKVQQIAVGENIKQTALITMGQDSTGNQMYVPASMINELMSMNLSLNINILNVEQVAIGNNIDQVALIEISQT
jgi:hypothetical protein